ncbi:unnamed protein product [Caenorhabditis angaria]|uniref:DUF4440 domain-containing protein n=1 Tax=Caenorhabditis angaria TaxID=860376 RepID=A0A9P1IR78_9PELO|nr:unnamed protein product [Caenorhabditis angaria]
MSSLTAQERLQPFIDGYVEAINSGNLEKLKDFYHPNSVMVEKDKSCCFGKAEIVKSLEQMTTECGKTTIELTNSKFEGTPAGDFINFQTAFAFVTEKAGVLRGNFLQIWRFDAGEYTIYHDEFEMI